MGVPIVGICCGQQVMMQDLGGKVEARLSYTVEYGRAYIAPDADRLPLLDGWFLDGTGRKRVWMSDGDHISELAPGFQVFTTSPGAPFAITADPARKFFAVHFHLELRTTPRTARRFTRTSCVWQALML
ncbi:GMP synthase (glutamine-hydrolysing) [Salipiger profundus]|nr:GMP synthase (glutamine-hydrolysing) [Salipiger profundus]